MPGVFEHYALVPDQAADDAPQYATSRRVLASAARRLRDRTLPDAGATPKRRQYRTTRPHRRAEKDRWVYRGFVASVARRYRRPASLIQGPVRGGSWTGTSGCRETTSRPHQKQKKKGAGGRHSVLGCAGHGRVPRLSASVVEMSSGTSGHVERAGAQSLAAGPTVPNGGFTD